MSRPSSFAIAGVTLLLLGAPLLAQKPSYQKIDGLGYQPGSGATLAPYLESQDPQERWRAARAIGFLGYKPAARALVKLMDDNDPIVQTHAIAALGRLGDDSAATVDAIMAKAASTDGRVARAALAALKKLSPGPEKLAAAMEQVLQSDDHVVMSYAVEAIVEAGGRATPLLQRALKNEKSAYWASLAISEIGPPAAETAPDLAELLASSESPFTIQQALMAVASLGDEGEPAAEAVRDIANNTGEEALCIAACYTLGAIGDESATDLLQRLEGEGGEFQQMVCAWSLSKLHPNDPDAQQHAIDLLTAALKSDRPEVREAAATGLSKLAAPSEKVAPALLSALEGANDEQKANIAAALASLGPAALDKAIAALDKPAFRDIAIEVIGRMGPEASSAAAPLAALLPSASEDQQKRINFALASIGPGANAQGAAVVAGLKSSDAAVRQSALFALRKLGPQQTEVLRQIGDFYASSDSDFEKLAAAWAVAAMEPQDEVLEAVVKALTPGLDSNDAQERLETVQAIGDLGAGGQPFAAKLRTLAASDPDSDVRSVAAEVAKQLP